MAGLFGQSLAHVETLGAGLRIRLDFDADQPELVPGDGVPRDEVAEDGDSGDATPEDTTG